MEYHSGGSLPLLGRPRYCPGANANAGYLCETGHCCGETGCCTYYYELWWFWLLWTVLILFSCCCAYRHRRAKLRVQQQQRQREISLLAYHGASSYPSSMLDLSFLASLKLPSYEEVAAQPSTPPPPYSSVFTTPRYPQPPRTADPHLLTQHDPLLHRPLSDGPSSLSSDNSSSCSCDSCCPSSPCSSSLSAPITYETDTSHASTPSEATPLALDLTVETIGSATTCLEVNETRLASELRVASVADADAGGAQEPVAMSSVPNQTVTVAVVTRVASPQPLPSPGADVTLGTPSPIKQQLDLAMCTPIVSTCSLSPLLSPKVVDTALPSIQIISIEGPETYPTPKITSVSGPSTPTTSTSDSSTATQPLETLYLTKNVDTANTPSSPVSVLPPDVRRTLALTKGSAGLTTSDANPSLVPIPAPSELTQTPVPGPANVFQAADTVPPSFTQDLVQETEPTIRTPLSGPVLADVTVVLDPQPETTLVQDSTLSLTLTPNPAYSNLTVATDAEFASPTSTQCQSPEISPGLALVLVPPSPRSGMAQYPGADAVLISHVDPAAGPVSRCASLVPPQPSGPCLTSPLPSGDQTSFSSGAGPGSCFLVDFKSDPVSAPAPALTFPTPETSASSCPAITVEFESSLAPLPQSPSSALSTSSPPCLPTPHSLPSLQTMPSTSFPAPALLLDPLTALHQSDKGGSSSGHASSLSPSPRATQSPPKQTLFSPCVDVFVPGPPNWEDGEEDQEEDNDDDEDEDVGADESQYRPRRLTGDSGIEVCRCRVEEEDEEEEGERKEDRMRGGGKRDKKGGGNTDLHDSVDCPARGQITTGEGLTLCNPTSTTTPTSEDSGKAVTVVETV
uniref:Uncharacterized protein n=1 Tax=Monopterus albus TaxID=43700 RepID=A0A3Q3J9E5_MONAL|nr:mucin-2-like [Monopterus albus]